MYLLPKSVRMSGSFQKLTNYLDRGPTRPIRHLHFFKTFWRFFSSAVCVCKCEAVFLQVFWCGQIPVLSSPYENCLTFGLGNMT